MILIINNTLQFECLPVGVLSERLGGDLTNHVRQQGLPST
jgi:hypothetical protein